MLGGKCANIESLGRSRFTSAVACPRIGARARLVLCQGSDASVHGEVIAKVVWFLVFGHEHGWMRREVAKQRGRSALGGADNEEIRLQLVPCLDSGRLIGIRCQYNT